MVKLIGILVLVCTLSGCAVQEKVEPIKIESIRPAPVGLSEENKTVTRDQLDRALESSRGSQNIRIVPLVTSAAQAPATPEYRVFNVRPNGIGELLGLKNADILVSAHGYVIQSNNQFYKYLQVLRFEKATWIEVRREGKPIILKTSFN